MPILSKEEAQTLLKKVLSYSKADECEVNLETSEGGNIRFAHNSVSTNGQVNTNSLVVQSSLGKKMGVATINKFDDGSLQRTVRRSEELAKLATKNPEYIKNLGPQQYGESRTFVPETASITPKQRADAAAESLQIARDNKLTAAGSFENSACFSAMMNSSGLFAYNNATNVNFKITLRTDDGKGSGYGIKAYNDILKLDVRDITSKVADKAIKSVATRIIEPGKYTVILEPAAGAVLLEYLFNGFDARQADEGKSFLSKAGGGTKLGEKLIDDAVTIYSDPQNSVLPSSPWAADGRCQEKVTWIDKGLIKNFYYSRFWGQKKGVIAIPPPNGVIMQGGTTTLDDIIKSTEKGILVTRLWYIRLLDPKILLLTGLTRDGTFYIENGVIKFPVKNFRFNESLLVMLNNLVAIGVPERTVSGESNSSYLIPPMKIRNFTFNSFSDAV